MSVRAKFKLQSITRYANNGAEEFKFHPVCADDVPENQRFHRYTPSGELRIYVDNPSAQTQFEIGKDYYLDFTPV